MTFSKEQIDAAEAAWDRVWMGGACQGMARDAIRAALIAATQDAPGAMRADVTNVAEYMGELCGAARADWEMASPGDVGLNGSVIKQWREAYFEGCKDMAQGITARLPLEYHDRIREIARAAFDRVFKETQEARQSEPAV